MHTHTEAFPSLPSSPLQALGLPCLPASSLMAPHASFCPLRPDPAPKEGPAPGEYDLPEAWRSGAAFTFGSKPQVGSQPALRGRREALVAFLLARDSIASCLGPTPVTHPLPSHPLPSHTAQDPKPPDSPGPGNYTLRPAFGLDGGEGPAFTFSGRPAERSDSGEGSPGPGDYHRWEVSCLGEPESA